MEFLSASRLVVLLLLLSVLAAQAFAAAPASAATQSFANPAPMTILDSGVAPPYPSAVLVSGMPGPVIDVNVTLHRVGHNAPTDIAVLLVSPSGDTVNVMRANCGFEDIEDFTWIFDQQAATPMPRDGTGCPEFVYRPNPLNTGSWPAPAPAGPHGVSLSDFNNENPNGTWRLYVSEASSVSGGAGDIEGGWTLTVTTGPADTAVPGTGSSGRANPYPATSTVSRAGVVITDVDVSLQGIWHQRPDDLDMLLVGPHGETVVLMSDACGTFEVAAFGWFWNDDAAAPMPDGDGTNVCGTTSHRPVDYEPGDSWPAPAPPGPHATALSAFDLTDPNGDWRLFVHDDSSDKVGFFTSRFRLDFATRPKAAVAFTESAAEVAEGASRALTLRRSGPATLGAAAVTVASVPASASSAGDFTPISTVIGFAPGETEKTVRVDALADAEVEADEVYAVAISSPTGDAAVAMPASVAVTIPGRGTTPPGTTPPATTPPGTSPPPAASPAAISRLRVAPRAFRAAKRGPSARTPGRRRRRTTGTIVSFTVDGAAAVSYRVRRTRSGRRAGRRCVAPRRTNRRARPCTRRVAVRGSFSRNAGEGANRFRFTGRIRGRKLPTGRYQLRATPRSNGSNGATSRVRFRIVR